MKKILINELNKIISLTKGEIEFYGSLRAGDGAVLKITKNKAYIHKDIPSSKDDAEEIIIYFNDFIELYGEAKFFELYELACLKVPNYKEDEKDSEGLIEKIFEIAKESHYQTSATREIIMLINKYRYD